MDKHLLAENPMRAPEGGLCIIRTVAPIGIFEIHEGHLFFDTGKNKLLYRHYTFKDEKFTISVHYFGGFKKEVPTIEEVQELAFKYMDDAWHWFKAYMAWKDQNIDKNDSI